MAEPEAKPANPDPFSTDYDDADLSVLYSTFMEHTRPIPDKVLRMLAKGGIQPSVLHRFGVRYYFKGYRDATMHLCEQFSIELVLMAGMIGVARDPESSTPRAVPVFEPYRENQVPYLILPYTIHGNIVQLKARPLIDKSQLAQMKLPTSISTRAVVPGWYNMDVLEHDHPSMLLLRDEFDVLAATSREMPAVGYGKLKNFRRDWVRKLAERDAVIVVDRKRQGDQRLPLIQRMFREVAGIQPHILVAPTGATGKKLLSFLSESMSLLRIGENMASDELEVDPQDLPGFDELLVVSPGDSGMSMGVGAGDSFFGENALELTEEEAKKADLANMAQEFEDPLGGSLNGESLDGESLL